MAQLIRKVTFDANSAPSPKNIRVGMAGDNNSRLIKFAVPALTDGQCVYVNVSSGGASDVIRLYADEDGLYGWTISHNAMAVFGNGTAQVKIIDPDDPLDIVWQSGLTAFGDCTWQYIHQGYNSYTHGVYIKQIGLRLEC